MRLDQVEALVVIASIVMSMVAGFFLWVIKLMLAPLKDDIGDCKRELSINGTSDTLRSAVKDTKRRVEENTHQLQETKKALDQHMRESRGQH